MSTVKRWARKLILLSISAFCLMFGFYLFFWEHQRGLAYAFFLIAFLFFIRSCLDAEELPKSALKEKKMP